MTILKELVCMNEVYKIGTYLFQSVIALRRI